MKTAAKILGITGGAVCLIYVIISIVAGPEAAHMGQSDFMWDKLVIAMFSALGIAGGLLAGRKIPDILVSVFLLLGGIFALVPDNKTKIPKEETI